MKILNNAVLVISYYAVSASAILADDISDSVGTPAQSANPPFKNLGNLIGSLLQLVYYIAGLFFFVYLLLGGIQWITSGGDKAGTQAARDRITSAFIGLVIVVGAYAITLIVEKVLGINILTNFNFQAPTT